MEQATANGSDLATAVNTRKMQLNKKLNKARNDLIKVNGKMNKKGYEEAVPDQVKENNR